MSNGQERDLTKRVIAHRMRQLKCSGETQWLNENQAGSPVENGGRVEKDLLMAIGHGSTSVLVNHIIRLHRAAAGKTHQAMGSPDPG